MMMLMSRIDEKCHVTNAKNERLNDEMMCGGVPFWLPDKEFAFA
jgi:hypothetical protein